VHPLLVIAAAAAAFWLGTEYIRRRANNTLPWDKEPKALPPLGTEIPSSAQGAANLEQWSAIDFAVDLFPASASRQQLPPPPYEDAISVAPDCSAVAVGHGAWFRLAQVASDGYEQGLSDPAIVTQARLEIFGELGRCISDRAPVALALLHEISRRVASGRALSLGYLPGGSGGVVYTPNGPRRSPNALLMRALTGRPWP
jgi:hypothetical protein